VPSFRAADTGTDRPSSDQPGGSRRWVVRRIEPWTVFRVSLVFYAALLVMWLVAGSLLWLVATAGGVIDNTEGVIEELFALETFRFEPGVILRSSLLGGVVLALVGTGGNVVLAVLYNLIVEVAGGIEVVLADEQPPRRTRF
jgi:hypothetical protein